MAGDARLLDQLIRGRLVVSKGYSSRRGAKVRLIAFHTAEGIRDAGDLGIFFAPASRRASSQVGIDDVKAVRYVPEIYSAWTAGNANPHATQVELCAFARWSVAEWERHPVMLEQAALWAAGEALFHDIPLVRVRGAATKTGTGVCMHIDLTKGFGGDHVDCGPAFTDTILDRIIVRARAILGQAAGVNLDELEALMATINDKNIDSPLPDGDRKVSLLGLIMSAAADAREVRDRLRSFDPNVRDHLAVPGDHDSAGHTLPTGGRFFQGIAALTRTDGGERQAAESPDPR